MAIFVSFCSFSVKPTDSAYQTHIHYWSVSNFASFDTPNSKFLKKSHFSKKCIFPDLPSKKPPCFAQCFFWLLNFWRVQRSECSALEIARLIIFEGWFFGFFQFLKWRFLRFLKSFFTNSCPFGSKIWQILLKFEVFY